MFYIFIFESVKIQQSVVVRIVGRMTTALSVVTVLNRVVTRRTYVFYSLRDNKLNEPMFNRC